MLSRRELSKTKRSSSLSFFSCSFGSRKSSFMQIICSRKDMVDLLELKKGTGREVNSESFARLWRSHV